MRRARLPVGIGWKDYKATGELCGITLPTGLRESDRLPEPIFTPATKADSGHDENISEEAAATSSARELLARLKRLTLELYAHGVAHAESKGIILADTKFEFGLTDSGELLLIDEMMTPDSSRYWPKDQYAPGGPQPSFDKQYVRDYLESIKWNKQPPVPSLPRGRGRRHPQQVSRCVSAPDRPRTGRRPCMICSTSWSSKWSTGASISRMRDGVRQALHRQGARQVATAICARPPRRWASTATPSTRKMKELKIRSR